MRKIPAIITRDHYQTPKTIPLHFVFEPHLDTIIAERLKDTSIHHESVSSKDLYIIDQFFTSEEGSILRNYTASTGFSRDIYGSLEAKEKGEKPARSMDAAEKWVCFGNPPKPIESLYKLFETLGALLNVEVMTLPWDLCDGISTSPAFATNYIEEMSFDSMESGKHEDYDPERGLPFAIDNLYEPGSYHPSSFINGETGRPLLVSIMLYSTKENFLAEDGMGSVFFTDEAKLAYTAACQHMRLVLFEGNIIHNIQNSLCTDKDTYRVSYVFKMILNPKNVAQCIKSEFKELVMDRKN